MKKGGVLSCFRSKESLQDFKNVWNEIGLFKNNYHSELQSVNLDKFIKLCEKG